MRQRPVPCADSYDEPGDVNWSPRIVLPFVRLLVLGTTSVVIGILRLGGMVTWPARWVVFLLFGLMVAPAAMMLLSATNEQGRQSEDWRSAGWWPFPWP